MVIEDWLLASAYLFLGLLAPAFLFVSSGLHFLRGSAARVRDIIVVALTTVGVFSTAAGVYGALANDESGQMVAAFYGFFFGSWIHGIALVIWLTCLRSRSRMLGLPEAVGAALAGAVALAFLQA